MIFPLSGIPSILKENLNDGNYISDSHDE